MNFVLAMNRQQYYVKGVLPIAVAAMLWGVGYFGRKLILDDVSALQLTFWNSLIVATFIFISCRLRIADVISTFHKEKWVLLAHSLAGIAIGTSLVYYGLSRIDLGIAVLLQNFYTVFTPIVAWLLLKESFSIVAIPYAILAFISAYFVVNAHPWNLYESTVDWVGVIAVIGAGVAWSFSSVAGKYLLSRGVSSQEAAFFRFAIGSILLFPIFFVSQSFTVSLATNANVIFIVLFTAIFGTGLGYLLLYSGLQHVKIGTSVFLELFAPVVAIALGVMVLGETLVFSQIVAIPLLLFSLYMVAVKS